MFDKGAVSFRVFARPEDMPSDAVERFAQAAAKPSNTVSQAAMFLGWKWFRRRATSSCSAANSFGARDTKR